MASSCHLGGIDNGCFDSPPTSAHRRLFSNDGNSDSSKSHRAQSSAPRDEGSKEQPATMAMKRLGDHPYGSREYQLWIPSNTENGSTMIAKASLRAHRNVLFAPQVLHGEEDDDYMQLLLPLFEVALADATINGEQPQATATLHGLCDWVISSEDTLKDYLQHELKDDDTNLEHVWEAVMAMATGIPRPGHSVVGIGTYRDGQVGWEILAKRYCQLLQESSSSTIMQSSSSFHEIQLFSQQNGQLVEILHLADTKPNYLRSAGGAMAQFFFL